jgi:DNA-binding NarL/FixJ family response regulator
MTRDSITVALVDDHDIVREGLAALLGRASGIRVVAQGQTGDDAIRIAADFAPDIIVLDVEMPGPPCEAIVKRIARNVPSTSILILTMHRSEPLGARLISAGAMNVLSKSVRTPELVRVIRESIAGRIRPRRSTGLLSSREIEVLTQMALGLSNAQIASELNISVGTVKRHANQLYSKLRVVSRMRAVVEARSMGML